LLSLIALVQGHGYAFFFYVKTAQAGLSQTELADNLKNMAGLTGVYVDDILNPGKELPKEVTVEDKTTMGQVRLIQQLDDEDKHVIFKMIETMLTKKRFKDFFQKNVAAL